MTPLSISPRLGLQICVYLNIATSIAISDTRKKQYIGDTEYDTIPGERCNHAAAARAGKWHAVYREYRTVIDTAVHDIEST